MSASRRRFSQEFKDELCQEVITTSKTIKDVAVAYGVGPETLRNWLNKYRETHGGTETEVTLDERARLKELERENSELRAETAFLKKAALDSNRQRNTKQFMVEVDDGQDRPTRTAAGGTAAGLGYVEIGIVDQ